MISAQTLLVGSLTGTPWHGPDLDPGPAPMALVVGPRAEARGAARAIAESWLTRHPQALLAAMPPAAHWPFLYPLVPDLPTGPVLVWVPDVHEAAVNNQTASTRLVTTQLAYLVESWRASLRGRDDVLLLATADADALAGHAADVDARHGRSWWYAVRVEGHSARARDGAGIDGGTGADDTADLDGGAAAADDPAAGLLARAVRVRDAVERLGLVVRALEHGRTAPALVAAASACMEVNDFEAAGRDLDEALALAPEWAAPWFERGKLWLRIDDMERACDAFQQAADRLPAFVSAWGNLGATHGELDRPDQALAAFEHAREHDPDNKQILNNIGVVTRELGRLSESEAAFRRVLTLVPDLAFGHYNLGHTLFLQGRYQAALSAYEAGQARDPERNPVQATRLAMCRLATGDSSGALRDLREASTALPRDYRRQLLADANAIAWALLTHTPDLPGWKPVHDWLEAELRKLG